MKNTPTNDKFSEKRDVTEYKYLGQLQAGHVRFFQNFATKERRDVDAS